MWDRVNQLHKQAIVKIRADLQTNEMEQNEQKMVGVESIQDGRRYDNKNTFRRRKRAEGMVDEVKENDEALGYQFQKVTIRK